MLVDQRGEFSDWEAIVVCHGPAWLKVFKASGAVLLAGDRVASAGKVPDAEPIRGIVAWLNRHHSGELALVV